MQRLHKNRGWATLLLSGHLKDDIFEKKKWCIELLQESASADDESALYTATKKQQERLTRGSHGGGGK